MKTLLIILLILFLIRWLILRYAPVLFASFFKNLSKQQGHYNPQTKTRKEGDVKIKHVEKPDKKIGKDVGDYVGYEEIKNT
jgi:hypothetical protein